MTNNHQECSSDINLGNLKSSVKIYEVLLISAEKVAKEHASW